jgi:pimeloyl-ACP methyl ester carboxylesterase
MNTWSRGEVSVDDLTFVYHRTAGDKPPLVLCHGITDNGLCFSRLARELEDAFDVIMVDARGHGESDKSAPESGSHVEDLAGIIEALGLQRPALMGHSMGAGTVAGVAAAYPERVSRIVLEDPPWRDVPAGEGSDDELRQRAEGFRQFIESFKTLSAEDVLARGKELSPRWHDDEFPAWVESNLQVAENVVDAMVLKRWQEIVPSIQCPTLLVTGDEQRGALVTEALRREIEADYEWIQTQHLEGAGHNIRREQFEAFVALVRAFLIS